MPQHGDVLYTLLLLIILVPVLVGGFHRSLGTLKKFYGTWRADSLREAYLVKYFFAASGVIIIFVALVLALAGFQREKDLEIRDYRGADIVFVMDISRSMLCEDVEPNRLKRAAGIARGVVERAAGARFGIVIFKGDAVKTIPVTEDTGAVTSFLDILDPVLLSSPGSNAEAALRSAAGAFPGQEMRRKIVVLFSDGESLTGNPLSAAEELAAADIAVIAVGTGTEEGGTIPGADGSVVVDATGRQVITRMDRDTLMQIAQWTSGEFLAEANPGIVGRIASAAGEGGDGRPIFINKETDVYRGFLLTALAGFCIFLFVRVKGWKNLD